MIVLFIGSGKRWMLVVAISAIVVAVTSLVLACVAITMSAGDKADNKNDDQNKQLDEHEKRLEIIEQQLNSQGKVETPDVSEIKPVDAFQISTHTAAPGRDDSAQQAIDGSDDTFMHTPSHTNPRWCADMQGIYHIKRVIVTNINKDAHGPAHARAINLRVGVTNTRPQVGENLALDGYTLCEEKPGFMGPVGIVNCPDGVSGQYVVVQFKTTDFMIIAEVKIYGYKDQL